MFSLNPITYELALVIALALLVITITIVFRLKVKIEFLEGNSEIVAQEKSLLQERVRTFEEKLEIEAKEKILLHERVIAFEEKYSDVFDREKVINELDEEIKKNNDEIDSLRSSYQQKKVIFDGLIAEAAIYDETIEFAELGFYKPSFSFEHSEQYKEKISRVKADQKQMIGDKTAINCTTEWTVGGSKSKGKTMTNRNIRMTARAFNNECDAAVSKVKWNNAQRMIERIHKAFDAINKLNESNMIFIDIEYLNLKINELKLTHEYHDKKQQEKEEQAEIRQQMREEVKLEKEMEDAFKEEDKFQSLLDKAIKQAQKASGDKLSELEAKIANLNDDLAEAHQKAERAKSMAEQTKVGHVYVISNIGSFGENVYKIVMTRRLEPLDRVKELGDASVPFLFDVHAMIYTENAPELEKSLHREFSERRLNLVNKRKEFFDVELLEIEQMVKEKHSDAEFYITAEAREYNESKAIRALKKEEHAQTIDFPVAI
jgi:hypothetical protein